jgi:hypothetical protein
MIEELIKNAPFLSGLLVKEVSLFFYGKANLDKDVKKKCEKDFLTGG